MKTKVIIALSILGLSLIGWKVYSKFFANRNPEIKYYGNVDTRTVMLGFRFLGEIKNIEKDEGMVVTKGEKLVELVDDNLQNSLQEVNANINVAQAELKKLKSGFRVEEKNEAKAQMLEAQANLSRAKDVYDRQSRLVKTHATSEENYIGSESAYKQAQAQLDKTKAQYELRNNGYRIEDIEAQEAKLKSLQAQAEKLKVDIRDSVIVAPVDGVILSRFKEPGSVVNPGENVLEVAKTDEYWIKAYVDETNLGKVKPGEKMLIYTDSRKEPYSGYVGYIAPNAEFTPKNIQTEELRADLVYRFRVIVKNPDNSLRQGMPVTLQAAKE